MDGDEDGESGSVYEASTSEEDAQNRANRVPESRRQTSASRSTSRNVKSWKDGQARAAMHDDNIASSNDPSRSRARKRAGSELPRSGSRARRLKGLYNDHYRELLNGEIHKAAAAITEDESVPLPSSQIGSSVWTTEEKTTFFAAVGRLGRDNLRGVASRIGSKSEPEVSEYVQILQQGLLDKKRMHQGDAGMKPFGFVGLPASAEISEGCCQALDEAAEALAVRQERYEERMEESKWGGSWLLTREVSDSLSSQLKKEGGLKVVDEALPAASLFKLDNWLILAEKFFMNSSVDEDNWQSIVEAGEAPAIRATALEDFYSLALSITKRLVSTTLFNAMSRLRAMDSKKVKHAEVTVDDVNGAVKIMNLALDSDEFWIRCARRCKLEVSREERLLSYDEVEKALSESHIPESCSPGRSRRPSADAELLVEEASFVEGLPSESDNEDQNNTDDPDDMAHSSSSQDNDPALAQEEYIETRDAMNSIKEEQRLWEVLGRSPPPEMEAKYEELPHMPKEMEFEVGDGGNWREWVK